MITTNIFITISFNPEIYEQFDQKRRIAGAADADRQDIEEIEDIEKKLKKIK